MKGRLYITIFVSFLGMFSMMHPMLPELPQLAHAMPNPMPRPIEDNDVRFKFRYSVPDFLEIMEKNSSLEDQRREIDECLSQKQCSEEDLFSATCLSIFKQKKDLASFLIDKGINIHEKITSLSLSKKLSPHYQIKKEIHYKWAPLCFAVIKWDPEVLQMLRDKGASFNDIESSEGFLPFLKEMIGEGNTEWRLYMLGQMGFPGYKDPSETDSLLPSSNKKEEEYNCSIQ